MRDTVMSWWERRLRARDPLEFVRVEGFDYRPRPGAVNDSWPNAVARAALYEDYQAYCEHHGIELVTPELLFFVTISPWVYPCGKKWHVKNYFAPKRQTYEGRWLLLKVRRYFVRLRPWEEHVAAFEQNGGPRIPVPGEGERSLIYT